MKVRRDRFAACKPVISSGKMEEKERRQREEDEAEDKKKRGGKVEEKKLTGRQLWERGLVGKVDEEDVDGDDAVPAIEKLKVEA